MILGGKAFGLMGTDELRRDLAVGLLWGTPLALFIGISVSIGSVVVGLVYGVYSGYKGKKTDEAMMRFNDVIYALPALPFLIILAVTISNSIFLMIGLAVLACFLRLYNFPMPPLILAFVLGGMMEENLRRSLLISDGSFNFLWDRPLTAIILSGTILLVSWQMYKSFKK